MAGALDGVKVLDLSRVLAGPTCTQHLGDLGAEVWKIENPATGGDDTRHWGPVSVKDDAGRDTDLSGYFLSANRNKYSVAVDLSSDDGQALIRRMVAEADVLVENFKPGGMAKYGLDADAMLQFNPGLIYCSISGYGQTGPNADKPGYDLMAQAAGGIMSITGEPDGAPMKVGVAVADIICGLQACTGILAALRHRDRTGEGQHVDIALLDSQMSWLINVGTTHLETGEEPARHGNAHPAIVPYQEFATADGHVVVAVGNDAQFHRFCAFLGRDDLPADPRFTTNFARTDNREALMDILEPAMRALPSADIVAGLDAQSVTASVVQTVGQALASDQAVAREMVVSMDVPGTAKGAVRLLGNPLKMSKTPVRFDRAPPRFGQDTDEIVARFPKDA
ncbi:Formyl-coenzyme A transferase [Rhodobacteraceae bacterium THAF1]|uniref:CaiB/BaiF CoA transferase family protein n=1 Tax=Palleronia sp. THAF1 TaxID=2587842 RepID=UPI000F414654|nr:CoA transferase [Palleronia sp. THAF1]QFU09631.1 Formyl-coenzyme A transferase [Palleronia sp. THAF1]VDC17468.1 Formyl-coenzyme A transferase [Rhodobacteraceae bacterium THAF1]